MNRTSTLNTRGPSVLRSQPRRPRRPCRPLRAARVAAIDGSYIYDPAGAVMHPDQAAREMERLRRAEERRRSAAKIASGAGWWQVHKPVTGNMIDANRPRELKAIVEAERPHRLVMVEFFSPECPACRALLPKLVQIAEANPSMLVVKVNCGDETMDEVRANMGISHLPYFMFFKGPGDAVAQFSASLRPDKLHRLRETVRLHTGAASDSVQGSVFGGQASEVDLTAGMQVQVAAPEV